MTDQFHPDGGHHFNGLQPHPASAYTYSDEQHSLPSIDFSAWQAYFSGVTETQPSGSHQNHFDGSPQAYFGGSPQGYFNGSSQTSFGGCPQAYFAVARSSRSPNRFESSGAARSLNANGHQNHASPRPSETSVSGLDPVSDFGFASSRSYNRNQHDVNGFSDAELYQSPPWYPGMPQHHSSSHSYAAFTSQSPENSHHRQSRSSPSETQQRKDDAAHRSAEVERRNRLRGEEKERRKVAIQKQVDDGIKALKLEKERETALLETYRDACRKWLSESQPSQTTSSAEPSGEAVDVYAALGRQLRGFWRDSRPSPSRQTQRDEVIVDVQRAINRKWPGQGLRVAAFGSSVTGLATESSDLDLVLLDPTRPYGVGAPSELCRQPNSFVRHSSGMPEWYNTHQVASAIKASSKFRNVVSISGASVPIVKMIHGKYDIPSDININERFGLFNSQLICAYADLQPDIVRPLIFFLKHWYSQRELNDPAGKRGSMTFSSYTIALMALQVLQIEGLLPNLQSTDLLNRINVRPNFLYSRPKRPRRRGNGRHDLIQETVTPPQKYNVAFASSQIDVEQYRKRAIEISNSDALATTEGTQASSTDRVLGKALASFVRFYATLDRRSQVISVVNGAPSQRKRSSQGHHVLFDSASEDEAEINGNEREEEVAFESQQSASRDAEGRAAVRAEQADVWEGDELVVQDPFITDRNTSRNIKANSIERWQGEMKRAIHLLGLDRFDKEAAVQSVKVPLVLDLCIPQTVLDDLEATGRQQANEVTSSAAAPNEPWRIEEETAAAEKEIARQAAEALRKEKKKNARRARSHNARLLQKEAAMVEDMIDGIETGRITGMMTGDDRHEIWRLRADNSSNGTVQKPTPIPFTFSVAKSPEKFAAQAMAAGDATLSPTSSVGTSKTDGSSSSEDIDLVALRLKRDTLAAEA
ncbi:uncharacterized protein UHOD_01380 [Ustilago sp. UG-2017b]|nr:uncharacterized protein UHOD_01380 [Ustilago sp. UG-2017b]